MNTLEQNNIDNYEYEKIVIQDWFNQEYYIEITNYYLENILQNIINKKVINNNMYAEEISSNITNYLDMNYNNFANQILIENIEDEDIDNGNLDIMLTYLHLLAKDEEEIISEIIILKSDDPSRNGLIDKLKNLLESDFFKKEQFYQNVRSDRERLILKEEAK